MTFSDYYYGGVRKTTIKNGSQPRNPAPKQLLCTYPYLLFVVEVELQQGCDIGGTSYSGLLICETGKT